LIVHYYLLIIFIGCFSLIFNFIYYLVFVLISLVAFPTIYPHLAHKHITIICAFDCAIFLFILFKKFNLIKKLVICKVKAPSCILSQLSSYWNLLLLSKLSL